MKRKREKEIVVRDDSDKEWSDNIDVLKHMTEVKSRIKKQINSDYVLAKLGDQDKEGIINMTNNAYYAQRLINKLLNYRRWIWDREKKKYKKIKLTTKEIGKLKEIGNRLFDTFMLKINMTVVLNRNIENNYLINVLTQRPNEEEIGEEKEVSMTKEMLKAENPRKDEH